MTMRGPHSRVFITHAAIDGPLAELVVGALLRGLRLPTHAIFCSSMDRHGIPTGTDFVRYIQAQLDGTSLVVPLVTPAYMDSLFCMWELGAAWIKDLSVHPLTAGPVSFESLPVLLASRQVRSLDRRALDELVERVANATESDVDWSVWEDERNRVLLEAPSVVDGLRRGWSETAQAKLRRNARAGSAGHRIHRAQHSLRDATHFILKYQQNAVEHGEFWVMLRTVATEIAAYFTESTGVPCSVTIKQVTLVDGDADSGVAPRFGVKDLTRSVLRIGDRDRIDLIADNTDFNLIWSGDRAHYLCNDIPQAIADGAYENSHLENGRELPYKSAAVWPIRKVLEDTAGTRQDLIGFLCVDSATAGTFDALDIEVGSAFADSLYILRPTIMQDD